MVWKRKAVEGRPRKRENSRGEKLATCPRSSPTSTLGRHLVSNDTVRHNIRMFSLNFGLI